jgi:hypothetical protein
MAYQYADYSSRSQRLINAGHQLIQSLADETIDRSVAIQDIESAAEASTASELVLRYASASDDSGWSPAERISPEDALSGVLLDVQAANVLLSAGVALNEHGGGSESSFLHDSMADVESSQAIVIHNLERHARREFAPASGIKSSTLQAAKKTFSDNAEGVLKDIVDDAAGVVGDVLAKLRKFDGSKVAEGIQQLGESFQVIAAAGKLIKRGLDMLKNALDALSKLFGEKVLASAKGKVAEIWQQVQSGKYTRDVLTRIFDVKATQAHIAAILNQVELDIAVIDGATNDLPGLADRFKGNMKLFRSLMSAVALAGAIITFLQLAAPLIPIALAGVYISLVAATVLVGMDYSDSGHILRFVRGVGEIANGIKPGPGKP